MQKFFLHDPVYKIEFGRILGFRRKMAVLKTALLMCAVLATSRALSIDNQKCTVKCSDITDAELG